MFPLYDQSTKHRKKPLLVIGLILFNILIFSFTVFSNHFEQIIFEFGLVPDKVLNAQALYTFLSAMFLHINVLHLAGNMWFLWIFGDNLEHVLGPFLFLVFYILVGVIASLVHVFTVSPLEASLPVIGASGAISGILGAYIILFPRNKIRAFMLGYFRPYFFSVPAWFYALVWFFYQMLYLGSPTSVAYKAHIGGFLSGIILILLSKHKQLPKLLRKFELREF